MEAVWSTPISQVRSSRANCPRFCPEGIWISPRWENSMSTPVNRFQCSVFPPLLVDPMVLILGVHRDQLPSHTVSTSNECKTVSRNCKNKWTNENTTTTTTTKIDVKVHIFSFYFMYFKIKNITWLRWALLLQILISVVN